MRQVKPVYTLSPFYGEENLHGARPAYKTENFCYPYFVGFHELKIHKNNKVYLCNK